MTSVIFNSLFGNKHFGGFISNVIVYPKHQWVTRYDFTISNLKIIEQFLEPFERKSEWKANNTNQDNFQRSKAFESQNILASLKARFETSRAEMCCDYVVTYYHSLPSSALIAH